MLMLTVYVHTLIRCGITWRLSCQYKLPPFQLGPKNTVTEVPLGTTVALPVIIHRYPVASVTKVLWYRFRLYFAHIVVAPVIASFGVRLSDILPSVSYAVTLRNHLLPVRHIPLQNDDADEPNVICNISVWSLYRRPIPSDYHKEGAKCPRYTFVVLPLPEYPQVGCRSCNA